MAKLVAEQQHGAAGVDDDGDGRGQRPRLAPVANAWAEALGQDTRYPATLASFLAHCHAQGQARPTPLLLTYGVGDYNRLHQDLYGEHVFPLQVAILLSRPGEDFTGGEVVLTEYPLSQSCTGMSIPSTMPTDQCLQDQQGGSLENFCPSSSSSTSGVRGTKVHMTREAAMRAAALRISGAA